MSKNDQEIKDYVGSFVHKSLPVPSEIEETKVVKPCGYCKEPLDEDQSEYASICIDCYSTRVLPTKSRVMLPDYYLATMTLHQLGDLPMTWGIKYLNCPLHTIPNKYWTYILNLYFKPSHYPHIEMYLRRKALI